MSAWRKRKGNSNPFLSSEAQESSDRTLEEISQVNPEFAKHRKPKRGGTASHNPYVDPSLYEAQNEYGPDANSQFLANHGVQRSNPFMDDKHKHNGHHIVSDSNNNGYHSRSNGYRHDDDSNQDADGAKSHYAHGKLSELKMNDDDDDTVKIHSDNPYHPSNFYKEKEDRETAKRLVQNHRKYPKAIVPKKKGHHGQHQSDKRQNGHCNHQPNEDDVDGVLDEMDAFFETVEAHGGHDEHAVFENGNYGHFVDGVSAMEAGDEFGQIEHCTDGDEDEVEEDEMDEVSEHFRQFMVDPDTQCPQSPDSNRSSGGFGDTNCIQGCERITPSNFHTMRAGDLVSILMENLWTYYKVVSNERNGDDYVAKFESGFASKEESVYIKGGVISKYLTVWGEQTDDQIFICREVDGGNEEDKQEDALDIVENGWIKMEDDGKLHLVVAYEPSSGIALLKAMGSNKERTADLSKCTYKVL